MTDEQLFEEFRATGSDSSFAELHRRHAPGMTASLMRYFRGDATAADDVLQQTFARVFTHQSEFQTGRTFVSWAYTMLVNLAIDEARRLKRERTVEQLAVEV